MSTYKSIAGVSQSLVNLLGDRMVESGNFPNCVIAAPAMRASGMGRAPRVTGHRRSTVWPAVWRSQVAGVIPRWRRMPYWMRCVSVLGRESTIST